MDHRGAMYTKCRLNPIGANVGSHNLSEGIFEQLSKLNGTLKLGALPG